MTSFDVARNALFSFALFWSGGLLIGVVFGWATASHYRHGMRRRRLEVARAALEKHIQALEALDMEGTPDRALKLAIEFSRLLQNPEAPEAILNAFRENPRAFMVSPTERGPQQWRSLMEDSPETIEPLYTALLAGTQAFLGRFPQARPAFEEALIVFGVAPVKEAQRVIEVTQKAMSSPPGVPAFAG